MSLSRVALAAVALFALAGRPASADEYWVFLGTYTGKDEQGHLPLRSSTTRPASSASRNSPPRWAARRSSTIHPNKKFLYAVGEGGGKDGGPVVAFALDAKTGDADEAERDKSGGAGPVPRRRSARRATHAVVANYGGGSTACFKLGEDGKLGERTAFVQHKGSGRTRAGRRSRTRTLRSSTPTGDVRCHRRPRDRQGEGVRRSTPRRATIDDDEPPTSTTPPGSRPAALRLRPGRQVRLRVRRTRLDRERDRVRRQGRQGRADALARCRSRRKGNSTAECICHPTGKFVYVSNRGHNSIAVFKVDDDRKLDRRRAHHRRHQDAAQLQHRPERQVDADRQPGRRQGGRVGARREDRAGQGDGQHRAVSRCVCVKFVPVAK